MKENIKWFFRNIAISFLATMPFRLPRVVMDKMKQWHEEATK